MDDVIASGTAGNGSSVDNSSDGALVLCGATSPVLRSVLAFLLGQNRFSVLIDDGTPDSVQTGLLTLQRLGAGDSLPLVHFMASPICGAWLSELMPGTVVARNILGICTGFRNEPKGPGLKALNHASLVLGKRSYVTALTAEQDHSMAARRMWETPPDFNLRYPRKDITPLNFVLIDDNEAFCQQFRDRVAGFASVWTCPDIETYLENQGLGKSYPGVDSVELFLIDIVDKQHSRIRLAGLESALPELRVQRGLSQWPVVVMVSHLPNEMINHLCCHAGADYYIEKAQLAAEPDLQLFFAKILYHSMHAASRVAASATDGLCKDIRAACKGWEQLPVIKDRDLIFGMTVGLLSREHNIARIDLRPRDGQKGKSTATTILVEPRLQKAGSPMIPRYVKIDNLDQVIAEWTAFRKYINPAMTQSFARIEPWFYRAGCWASLAYCLAGSRDAMESKQLKSLWEVVWKSGRDIPRILNQLFTKCVKPLHNYRLEDANILSFMGLELLPVPITNPSQFFASLEREYRITRVRRDFKTGEERRIEFVEAGPDRPEFPCFRCDVSADMPRWMLRPGKLFRAGIAPQMETLPLPILTKGHEWLNQDEDGEELTNEGHWNPLRDRREAFVQHLRECKVTDWLARVADFLQSSEVKERIECSVVHGDLSLANVLFSEEDEQLWLIDFARTKPGPFVYDYVVFEYHVRFNVLVPVLLSCLHPITDSQEWVRKAREIVARCEEMLQWGHNYTTASLTDLVGSEVDSDLSRRFERAWTSIRHTQTLMMKATGGNAKLVRAYQSLFVLYGIRALQKHEAEFRRNLGPLGSLWAWIAAERMWVAVFEKRT